MRSVSGKELARVLERHGWTLLRIQGSHHNLWETRKQRSSFDTDSWQYTPQDRPAEAPP